MFWLDLANIVTPSSAASTRTARSPSDRPRCPFTTSSLPRSSPHRSADSGSRSGVVRHVASRATVQPEHNGAVPSPVPATADRSRPVLAVRGLTVDFGPFAALRGVDLEVLPGEVVALTGENGAGKTTLVRSIAGDISPTGGEILVAGHLVAGDATVARRLGVAVVWQDLALCDNMSVAANLLLGQERGLILLSDARFHARAAALLDELGIRLHDTTESVRSLSGGQRQLLAVARAVRDHPKILLLDEATAALGVSESAEVESLVLRLREQQVAIVLVSHDIEQLFRLADRIVVLRDGRVVAEVDPSDAHPDDVVALVSGQELDSSARGQLTRLHGLADRLASSDRSSSLSLILSTLGAALGTERMCIHLVDGSSLACVASIGLPPQLSDALARIPVGSAGGPLGLAAAAREPVVVDDVQGTAPWSRTSDVTAEPLVGSSWTVPISGSAGLLGVFSVFPQALGRPRRDELDLVTLYAGYAASAIERDRLFGEVTTRNRVLETLREVLETLAGPVPVGEGLQMAVRALRSGLRADEVALVALPDGPGRVCRARAGAPGVGAPDALVDAALSALSAQENAAVPAAFAADAFRCLAVRFLAPGGDTLLLASWSSGAVPEEATALMGDAARSLRLALEREEIGQVQQEAAALRRSHELQRGFLSRLSHELRTPLTAIRGYASSLMQTDVTWDGESQRRFLTRIAAESARLGRLVDDLLDISAIESGVMRLQRDWCDIPLVADAAAACLPPAQAAAVRIDRDEDLPVVWADHDRLEQVLVNLMDNAFRHNAPGRRVVVGVHRRGGTRVAITVADDGSGVPPDVAGAPFEPGRRRSSPTAGTGLGLSIAKGIVDAHGGTIELEPRRRGTTFRIELPIEAPERPHGEPGEQPADGDQPARGPAPPALAPAARPPDVGHVHRDG